MKNKFGSWQEIKDWAEQNGFEHLAKRMELNNMCWNSSGEFGRSQVFLCDSIRFAENEEEARKIAKAFDEEMEENYGLY